MHCQWTVLRPRSVLVASGFEEGSGSQSLQAQWKGQTGRGLAETLQCLVWVIEHRSYPLLFAEESGPAGLAAY